MSTAVPALRWVDDQPFDVATESQHYLLGIRRKTRRIYPTLAAYLDAAERIEAHGAGLIGQSVRCFWIATDRGLYVFATPLYRDTILDHSYTLYADVESCTLKISRLPQLLIRLGTLQMRSKSGATVRQRAIPAKQAESLRAALLRRLPDGVLTD